MPKARAVMCSAIRKLVSHRELLLYAERCWHGVGAVANLARAVTSPAVTSCVAPVRQCFYHRRYIFMMYTYDQIQGLDIKNNGSNNP